MNRLERELLLAPDMVARLAAAAAPDREQRWMLAQGREIRRSYLRDVVDRGDDDLARQRWMLRQSDAVRESYLLVLAAGPGGAPPELAWMLRQPAAVRESYVREVLDRR
ncbi:MAG: hypothetical protein JWO02_2842 [Solirubrobacterales bacterium]|nr:hypothetical protein [Solirubrobacterales bacterium]